MYRKDVSSVWIRRVRFNDYNRSIHTDYRGSHDGKQVGWSEMERIATDKEWFERKLKGK